MELSRGKAVQEVEKAGHENHDSRLDGHVVGEKQDGQTARDEVAAGDGVWNVLFEAHFRRVFSFCKGSVFSEKQYFCGKF